MFICTEWIEETGRPPGLIFGMWGYFWHVGISLAWLGQVRVFEKNFTLLTEL